jgi:hypothetical protein
VLISIRSKTIATVLTILPPLLLKDYQSIWFLPSFDFLFFRYPRYYEPFRHSLIFRPISHLRLYGLPCSKNFFYGMSRTSLVASHNFLNMPQLLPRRSLNTIGREYPNAVFTQQPKARPSEFLLYEATSMFIFITAC